MVTMVITNYLVVAMVIWSLYHISLIQVIDYSPLELIELESRLYGGCVTPGVFDDSVTHVVLDKRLLL